MSHYDSDYASRMRERGYRVTPQRQLILDALCEAGNHATPDQIYDRVRAIAPAINRATVYRTLDFLCELRLIVAMQWGKHTYYEIAGVTPHHHLICRTCGAIEQIDPKIVNTMVNRIDREQDFGVDMDHIVLFGLCARCRPAGQGSRRASSALPDERRKRR